MIFSLFGAMLRFISYLFFFFVIPCFSQTKITFLIENLDSITNNRVNWKEIEKKTLSQKEKDAVRIILKDTTRFLCYDSEHYNAYPDIDLFLDDFHFIDIDGDKDFDIIYNGKECPGFESETIHVYINHKGSYKHALLRWGTGTVVSVKNNELVFYQYPCCAEIRNVYSVYKTQKDSIILNYGIVFFTPPSKPPKNGFSSNLKKLDEILIEKDTELCFFAHEAESYNQ